MKCIVTILPLLAVSLLGQTLNAPCARAAQPSFCTPRADEIEDGRDRLAMVPPSDSAFASTAVEQSSLIYYVSPGGNDRWSGRVAAPNSDGSDGPFATIERARDAIRAERQTRPATGRSNIYLRGGRYQLKAPIVFTEEDAGTQILAAQGEHPELTGAISVAASHSAKGKTLAIALPSDPGNEVFVGGTRLSLAVKPIGHDDGWRVVTSMLPANSFAYSAQDISPDDKMVELVDRSRSLDVITPIVSLDEVRHLATVAPFGRGPIEEIEKYRLLGNRRWIAGKSRFGWDAPLRILTLIPTDPKAVEKTGVQIPVLGSLFIFRGASNNTVSGVSFVETRGSPAIELDSAAIVLEHATNIALRDNRFRNVSQAIRLVGSSANRIVHNAIQETGSTGIELQDGSDRNLVVGNVLDGVGQTDKAATAVYLHGATANLIARNDIGNVARHGIGIDNWDEKTENLANIVEYNRISNTNLHTTDTGAIEMLGRSRLNTGSIIRYNEIKDVGPSPKDTKPAEPILASGIYLDDFTSGVLVCGNRVSGAPSAAVQIHGGSNITVRDNLVLLDRRDADFVYLQRGESNTDGHPYDFTWTPTPGGMENLRGTDTGPSHHNHRMELSFDNDAVIGGEDRDLFVESVKIGAFIFPSTDARARYLVADGRVMPGQVAMPWNGKLVWDVADDLSASTGPVAISVLAWANPAGGIGAHFVLAIDGKPVGEATAQPPVSSMRNNIVTHNIIYATASGKDYFRNLNAGAPLISENNFTDITGTRPAAAIDSNPVHGDPEFIAVDAGDYRLRPSSPLHAEGFNDLPISPDRRPKAAVGQAKKRSSVERD